MDETGWKVRSMKAWLWTAVTPGVAFFTVRFSRGSKVVKEMIGGIFRGILVSDRWPAYNRLDPARRQLCWAHLMRDFFKISQRSGAPGKIGTQLLEQAHKMFALWRKVRDGPSNNAPFKRQSNRSERQLRRFSARAQCVTIPRSNAPIETIDTLDTLPTLIWLLLSIYFKTFFLVCKTFNRSRSICL
jgi:transposase